MPQSFIHRRGPLAIGPTGLDKQPELARLMARVIVSWTTIETNISMMFAVLLHGKIDISLDIYHAFQEQALKQRVFMTVAKKHLPKPTIGEVRIFFNEMRDVSAGRNKIAHSTWFYTDEHPECLCTLDARYITEGMVLAAKSALTEPERRVTLEDTLLGKRMMCYDGQDFNDIHDRINSFGERSLKLALRILRDRASLHEGPI